MSELQIETFRIYDWKDHLWLEGPLFLFFEFFKKFFLILGMARKESFQKLFMD